jgi:isopentenyl diphosphate isomerase/L-lactate dehydrogenase-like FMN-dependent dehydrogenase
MTEDAHSLLNLSDYEPLARERLPPATYDYYAGGAEDERTVRGNTEAYSEISLRPRVLVDVSRVDTSIELFGQRISFPVLLAPTAFQRLAHAEGELATARAAKEAGTILVASSLSTVPLEAIADRGGPVWFQLCLFRERSIAADLVQRAEAAGYGAICLTVTVPVQGNRERDARNRFQLPPGIEMANFTGLDQSRFPETAGSGLGAYIGRQFDPALDWSALEWLRSRTKLPILLKGVVTPEDARLAVEHGASGLIVSNHGGRQLDGAEPTVRALPRVVEATEGKIPVLVDGGIRRGTDVVTALALGARAVLIGRPYLWALAVDGEAGVARVLALLRREVERTMQLVGAPEVRDITRELVAP